MARVSVLVLIAVGLSQPALSSLKTFWGRGQATAVAVVLDNSASMGVIDDGRPRFETAKATAEQVLAGLHEGDPVGLFPTGGPPAPEHGRLYHAQETVRQALAQTRVSYERADLAAKLQLARARLLQSDAPVKEIYVITDNQAVSWDGLTKNADEGRPPSPKIPVVVVNVNHVPMLNVALRTIHLQTPAPVAGVPVQVTVDVVNPEAVAQQKHVELHVDGVKVAVSPTLNLPPGGRAKHAFQFTPDQAGAHRGEVRLAEEDGSPLDNRLFFADVVGQQVPVALVRPRRHEISYVEDTFYLERRPGRWRGRACHDADARGTGERAPCRVLPRVLRQPAGARRDDGAAAAGLRTRRRGPRLGLRPERRRDCL